MDTLSLLPKHWVQEQRSQYQSLPSISAAVAAAMAASAARPSSSSSTTDDDNGKKSSSTSKDKENDVANQEGRENDGHEFEDDISYTPYKPAKLKHGRNHTDPVVENATLAAVAPPAILLILSMKGSYPIYNWRLLFTDVNVT